MNTNDIYVLLKNVGPYLKGELFNTFSGDITGIVIKEKGKNVFIEFTDKNYFKLM